MISEGGILNKLKSISVSSLLKDDTGMLSFEVRSKLKIIEI